MTKFYEVILENVSKRAFGELDNTFQAELNEILAQQSRNVYLFFSYN